MWNGSFKSVTVSFVSWISLVDRAPPPEGRRAVPVEGRPGGHGRDSGAGAWARPCAVLVAWSPCAAVGLLGAGTERVS